MEEENQLLPEQPLIYSTVPTTRKAPSKNQSLSQGLTPTTNSSSYPNEFVFFFNPRSGSQMASRYGSLSHFQYESEELGARVLLVDVCSKKEKEMGMDVLRKLSNSAGETDLYIVLAGGDGMLPN